MGILVLLVAGSGLVAASFLTEAAWLDPDTLSIHRQGGILTLIVLVALGGLSGVLLVSRSTAVRPAWAMKAVLVLAIAGVAAAMWTAYLGGTLRHTELGRARQASQGAGEYQGLQSYDGPIQGEELCVPRVGHQDVWLPASAGRSPLNI